MAKPTRNTSTGDYHPGDIITIRIDRTQLRAWQAKWSRRLNRLVRAVVSIIVFTSAVLGILAYFRQ